MLGKKRVLVLLLIIGLLLVFVSCTRTATLRNLTEEEKSRAIEIALSTSEAQAQLEQGITYKSDLNWVAIVWQSLRASEIHAFDYVAWETGIPSYIPRSAVIYSRVSLIFGEPERLLVEVAVDLATGKAVWVQSFPLKSLPSTLNLIFKYGVFAKNELNTFNGTYTKDMVQDPSITVELSLSKEELDSIYEKMVEIDFFNYPDNFSIIVPPNKPHGIVTPYSSYYFKVQHDSEIKELWWADEIIYEDIQADKLKELINLIRDIIESKDEYKSLPESKGGYM